MCSRHGTPTSRVVVGMGGAHEGFDFTLDYAIINEYTTAGQSRPSPAPPRLNSEGLANGRPAFAPERISVRTCRGDEARFEVASKASSLAGTELHCPFSQHESARDPAPGGGGPFGRRSSFSKRQQSRLGSQETDMLQIKMT
ncbi:hypothetical protein PG997_002451 [Apiospora hydei]|uniref:Uncharacterized protein n=1 Tax=Apiospora hydei TaxID=1337664 RepID=A0ABR1X9L4_9PEZI